jgi:ectoine hydroxylase-related dioxygenase (phytanoyl-CoA dioxygenase family)
MTTTLGGDLVERYETDGYLCPVTVLDARDVERFRGAYDAYEQGLGEQLAEVPARDRYVFFAETHAFLPWAYELATWPAVLDAVESLIGPDLLVWDSRWFTKRPGDPAYISWHQDGTYWELSPPKVCTAWIALSRSFAGNGAMQVVPGSHSAGQLPHVDTFDEANALARGQEIAVDVDEAAAVTLTLEPGQMSIHHIGVVHGSKPNTSNESRIGFAVRFIAAEVEQAVENPMAMLVRGTDRHGNFDLLEAPTSSTPEEIEAKRSAIIGRMYSNLLPDE